MCKWRLYVYYSRKDITFKNKREGKKSEERKTKELQRKKKKFCPKKSPTPALVGWLANLVGVSRNLTIVFPVFANGRPYLPSSHKFGSCLIRGMMLLVLQSNSNCSLSKNALLLFIGVWSLGLAIFKSLKCVPRRNQTMSTHNRLWDFGAMNCSYWLFIWDHHWKFAHLPPTWTTSPLESNWLHRRLSIVVGKVMVLPSWQTSHVPLGAYNHMQ